MRVRDVVDQAATTTGEPQQAQRNNYRALRRNRGVSDARTRRDTQATVAACANNRTSPVTAHPPVNHGPVGAVHGGKRAAQPRELARVVVRDVRVVVLRRAPKYVQTQITCFFTTPRPDQTMQRTHANSGLSMTSVPCVAELRANPPPPPPPTTYAGRAGTCLEVRELHQHRFHEQVRRAVVAENGACVHAYKCEPSDRTKKSNTKISNQVTANANTHNRRPAHEPGALMRTSAGTQLPYTLKRMNGGDMFGTRAAACVHDRHQTHPRPMSTPPPRRSSQQPPTRRHCTPPRQAGPQSALEMNAAR